jgi:hypothetical protein
MCVSMYVCICVYMYLFIYYVFHKKIQHIVQNNCDSKLWLSCNRLVGILDAFMSRDNTDLSLFVTKCSSTEIFITDLYYL